MRDNYEYVALIEFDDREALEAYLRHPAHEAAGAAAAWLCPPANLRRNLPMTHSRKLSRISYTVGITSKVSSVEVITPPMTARPSGALKSAPSPRPHRPLCPTLPRAVSLRWLATVGKLRLSPPRR